MALLVIPLTLSVLCASMGSASLELAYVCVYAPLLLAVCGHPTIVHGGALAAVFDDCFGALFVASRFGNGFTANLSIDYRRPVPAGTDLILDVHIDRVETGKKGSKKIFFKGVLRAPGTSDAGVAPVIYTEGTALFVVKSNASSDDLHNRIAHDTGSSTALASSS